MKVTPVGSLSHIKSKLWSFARMIAAASSPLHANSLTLEELEECIRLHKVHLNDPLFRKSKKHRARAHLGLALCYYKKAYFYSEMSKDDVNLAIHFAHQAEAFFTRDISLRAWSTIQKILGNAYIMKADGPRAEHYELAIPYLENSLELAEAASNHEEQIELRIMLMMASANRFAGTKSEKRANIERHATKLIELYPDKEDTSWVDYINELKVGAYLGAEMVGGIGNVAVTTIDALPGIFRQVYGDDWPRGKSVFGSTNIFKGFAEFLETIDPLLERATSGFSDEQLRDLHNKVVNNDLAFLVEVVPPEDIKVIQDLIDRIIQENLEALNKSESVVDRCYLDSALAMFYFHKAKFASQHAESDESLDQARFHFERGWKSVMKNFERPFNVFMDSRIFGTILYFRYQRWPEADELYRAALDMLDKNYRSSLGIRGKQFTLLGVSGESLSISLLLNQAYVLARRGKLEEAVVLLEKWRGRQLNERLKRIDHQLAKVRPEDLATYQQAWSEILGLEAAQRDAGDDEYLDLARKLMASRAKLDGVLKIIRSYLPEFLAEQTFAEVRQAATSRQPLAYLLATEVGGLILVVLASGEVRCLWCDEFTVRSLETLLEKLLAGSSLSDISRTGEPQIETVLPEILPELGRHLLASLAIELQNLRVDEVCLIPCGSLALLPLHAAPMADGRPLTDAFAVSYAPSANALLSARQKVERLKGHQMSNSYKLVALADPGGNLPNAVPEVEAIVGVFGSPHRVKLLLRKEATKESLKAEVPDATHVHFACHGEFNLAEPLEAALVLADGQRLTLRETFDDRDFQLLPAARMVVLSACKTALIDFKELPEEVIGLPVGFLAAGVPGVVGTLWPVADLSTALLMAQFYVNLMKPETSPARALSEAQEWLRLATFETIEHFCSTSTALANQSYTRDAFYRPRSDIAMSRPFANPYYWAGFIFVGA